MQLIINVYILADSGRPSSAQGVYSSGYEAGASPLPGYSPSTPQATPLTTQSSSLPRISKASSPTSAAQTSTWSNPHIRQVIN